MRRSFILGFPFLLVACGQVRPETPAASSATTVSVQEAPQSAVPAPVVSPLPAPVATPPTGPIDERFAVSRDGWRVDYHLRLPALPPGQTKSLRHASIAWLFQGLAQLRPTFAATGEAALATLIADGGKPSGVEPWHSDRAVVATHQGGGWLALSRSESSFAGGAHGNNRIESLIVELDGIRALTLDEIVPPEQQGALRKLLAGELRRVRGLPADGPLTSEIASDADLPIPLPLLDADGARFVWNVYEIAPYSEGAFEVALPAAQARPFLAVNPWP